MPHYKVTRNHAPSGVLFDGDAESIGTLDPFEGPLSYCQFNPSPIPTENYLIEVTNHPFGDWSIVAYQGNEGGIQGFWTSLDGGPPVYAENPGEMYNRMINLDSRS